MQSLLNFLGVAFVVQFQQTLQDFTTGGFTDGEADALLGLVEAVVECEIVPAVGGGDGDIDILNNSSKASHRPISVRHVVCQK